MTGSVGPSSGSGQITFYNLDGTPSNFKLNISQDTLISLSNQINSTGIQFDSSRPDLTILGFSSLVNTAIRENKRINNEFDVAGSYKDYYLNLASTAEQIKVRIDELKTLREEYNDLAGDVAEFRADLIHHVNQAIAEYNATGEMNLNLYDRWGKAQDAVILANGANTTTLEQTNAYLNEITKWRNVYNERINNVRGEYGDVREVYNRQFNYDGQGDLATRIINMNAKLDALNIDLPTFSPISGIPNYNNNNVLPDYFGNPNAYLLAVIPPPYPQGLYFPDGDPRNFQRGTIPIPLRTLSGNPLPSLPFPPTPMNTAGTPPGGVSEGDFKTAYIEPLKELLKSLKDAFKRIENEVDFQNIYRVVFGQAAIGQVVTKPGSAEIQVAGSGNSSTLAAIAGNIEENARFEQEFSSAAIESLLNINGVPAGSPIIPVINGVVYDVMASIIASGVPNATSLSQGAFVGATPQESPAILVATALATAEAASALIGSGELEKQIEELLLSDPSLVGKSAEEIKLIAQGVVAALNLEIIKMVVSQVASSIGLAGLIPQLLASLGSVSKEEIIQLINGLVNYKQLGESPVDQALVFKSFSNSFAESLGIDQQRSDIIIGRALSDFNKQGPFDTDDAAKEALKKSLLDALSQESTPPPRENSLLAIDQGFKSLETSNTPTTRDNGEPITRNKDLTNEDVQLTPQQQLQDDLKALAFSSDLKAELAKSRLEADDFNRISNRIEVETAQAQSLAEKKAAAEKILSEEGLDNGDDILAAVNESQNNQLRSFTIDTPPQSREELAINFSATVANILTTQGIRSDVAAEQADRFAAILFNNDPKSIASLTETNIANYSKQVEETQEASTFEVFREVMKPILSVYARNQEIIDPANLLVFLSNPIIYGGIGPRVGTGGGALINPISNV